MTRFRLFALALGAVVACDAGAHAQTNGPTRPPGGQGQPDTRAGQPGAQQDANPQARPELTPEQVQASLRRIRDSVSGGGGGRGGRGGGIPGMSGGQNGMLMLLMSNEVLQKEIGLTEDQKEQLKAYQETARDQMREMFSNMRGGGGNNARPNFRDPKFQAQMQEGMQKMATEAQSTLSKILDKDQKVRLNQIRLQIIGPLAVAEEEIAQAIMLNDQQFQQVKAIVKEMEAQQGQVMQALRQQGGFGGPGGPGGPGQAQTRGQGQPQGGQQTGIAPTRNGNNTPANNANQNAQAGGNRRGFDPNSPEFQAMRQRMEEATAKQEAIRKKAESVIGKTLLQKQRAKFNSMLGEKFDLEALARASGGGFGGFGGGPGGGGGRGGRGGGN